MLIISLNYTPVTQYFNVCSSHTTFKLQRTRIQNTQIAVYISDTLVTFKQRQGHQTKNDNVDSNQGYNHAKFERSCFKSVREKGNVRGVCFSSNEEIIKYVS